VILTVISVAVELVLGMLLALAMHRAIFGRGLIRTAALIPYGIVTVVAAFARRRAFSDADRWPVLAGLPEYPTLAVTPRRDAVPHVCHEIDRTMTQTLRLAAVTMSLRRASSCKSAGRIHRASLRASTSNPLMLRGCNRELLEGRFARVH